MSDKTTSDAQFIDVDLEQWRRDINTFASTTQGALDAIVDELSNALGGSKSASRRKPNEKTNHALSTNQVAKNTDSGGGKTKPVTKKTSDPQGSNAGREDRLASVKQKLASRMAKKKS